jgi:hypothetical protein
MKKHLPSKNLYLVLIVASMSLFYLSCKKDVKPNNISHGDPKTVMTQKQQVCISTYWITEDYEGGVLVSRTSDLISVSCSSGGGSSSGGGGGGTGDPNSTPIIVEIKTDSLKKKFPCVYQLLESISSHPQLCSFLEPFIKAGPKDVNPNLTWYDKPDLAWNNVGETQYALTESNVNGERVSSNIYLNTNMLKNSSPALVATTMVHEMIHAYLNTVSTFAGYGIVADDTKPILERLNSFAKVAETTNGKDHLTILSTYVGTIAQVVGLNDGNKRSQEDYFKLVIGCLYNDTGKTPSVEFNSEFDSLLTKLNTDYKFSITMDNASQMVSSQKRVPANKRVKCLL